MTDGNRRSERVAGPMPTLDPLFRDGAVLQRNQSVRVWGTAEPGARVALTFVRTGTGNKEWSTAYADESGRWEATLPAHPAGGPYELLVESNGEQAVSRDLLFGDVWLLGGQSNMWLWMDPREGHVPRRARRRARPDDPLSSDPAGGRLHRTPHGPVRRRMVGGGARRRVRGVRGGEPMGPMVSRAEVREACGDADAGAAEPVREVTGRIGGRSEVLIDLPDGMRPGPDALLRYAWGESVTPALANDAGLLASPFEVHVG